MKLFLSILFVFLFFSCSLLLNPKDEKKVLSTLCYPLSNSYDGERQRTYSLILPKGFIVDNTRGAWHFQRDIFKYKDSTQVYIVNNSWHTPQINYYNKLFCNIDTRKNFLVDTLYMKGQQKNGKYWKEYIYDDVVIGYINVPEKEKGKFDKAIESLTLVKTRKCK